MPRWPPVRVTDALRGRPYRGAGRLSGGCGWCRAGLARWAGGGSGALRLRSALVEGGPTRDRVELGGTDGSEARAMNAIYPGAMQELRGAGGTPQ